MRRLSLWGGLTASIAILAACGCKSTSSNSQVNANPVNGSGTRSALVATADDPLSLNTKTPPPGPDLYVSTARVYEATHNPDAAKEQFDRALKIDPAYLPALLGNAHLLDIQKEFAEADKYYEIAAKKHPDAAAVYNDWGMSEQRRGHLDESAKLLTKATRLQPEKQLYRNNLAMVLVVMHRPQEAYRQLAAIEAPAVAHFNLATVLHRAGDDQMAAYHFVEASKLDPSWGQAREWAERLGSAAGPGTNSSIAFAGDMRMPPPEPRPDGGATEYVASRMPDSQPPAGAPPTETPLPSPMPEPAMDGSAALGRPEISTPNVPANGATGAANSGAVEAAVAVTPTSAISYPAPYSPATATSVNGSAEPASPAAMPPLPPNGMASSDRPSIDAASTGLAPLPPVR